MTDPGMVRIASIKLSKELKDLLKNPNPSFSVGLIDDDLFKWNITLFGPADTPYDGGVFQAVMSFPTGYPYAPPTLTFKTEMWHPNVYKDGRVCISILHTAGDDPHGYEDAEERWSPAQTVETILISVLAMLSSPNDESPANIDAALEIRNDPKVFRRNARRCAERSTEIPCNDLEKNKGISH
ncbi:hypothetical protein GGI01_002154 [Coemansia sp. RSA 376]|nr:hypothetical protein H4S03_005683 [Coemansia sp. S3946]KAJ2042133.1 hypothetical protein H4S04_007453 [Coemansia sp. S16]KAJ2072195.1 hypothetical protein GGH13_002855 [Coemansia sp. S155-1]KAJ2080492.1 hypothetical protein GGI09_007745 [Coemansia sp. S100]KAJ2098959.1 hypothetical protein GGI16_004138 [Coemansia sp. S142-1]KAJ2108117.1 hypothetical protein IW146_006990 [Coemansia sp. RSA 922]KAJ2249511.1 hypothetical protein GGI13_004258 [Coemansia sp. RSA 455]KAJ2261620.1 hypothetical p